MRPTHLANPFCLCLHISLVSGIIGKTVPLHHLGQVAETMP